MENGMDFQRQATTLPSYPSGNLEAPQMDLETQEQLTSASDEECSGNASQGSLEIERRAPPRADSCPDMDTRPPLEVMGMESQLDTAELGSAFHMQELLSELPTFTCPSNHHEEESCLGKAPYECQPCLLHVAMGKGFASTRQRLSESSPVSDGSHGLLRTDSDKDGMFTLFQCEESTLSVEDTGTPLARLEAISSNEQYSEAAGPEEEEYSSLSSGLSREDSSCSLADSEPQRNVPETSPLSQNYPAPPKVPGPCEPEDLLDGVVFGAKYLGSTQLQCERHQMASTRMRQAQEAVDRVKAPDGESQPMTEVDVMVSTQRVKVLTADTQEALMDHPLKTISYTADIGNIVVIMARRKSPKSKDQPSSQKRPHKILCHVFQSVDVYIQKERGEMLGVAVVESGWGSLLPTVVLANLMHGGPAELSGELSIGDHVTSVNGTSLVGLPFSTSQGLIRELKGQSEVILSIVRCPPVVTAIIQRPDTTYQLGFCVEDGVICSLVRGGIAERGGIRVGHRIIEINGQSVVATAHEKIIQTLLDATGEVHIKTMPASTYRLLTGQETPVYL
ncbi:amyloid-beta A4 precursor protein-binding family A member 3 isoform X2 [Rhinoderma darwinii]|uniref:amyloid-beta A4 precursor protein-binding family A member 3 isoform X2 n=1 Tax=Rhinoderma darwinii TaxID=43563 RepID=UPI003F68185D